MFKMKNIYQEIDIGDWSGGYSSSSSSNESNKKNREKSLTKESDYESRSSSHESVDTVPIFTTMFTGTTL